MSLPASWHGNWSGLSAVVLGLGKSGFSVVDTLTELGVNVTALAREVEPQTLDLAELIGATVLQGDDPSLLERLSQKPDFASDSPGIEKSCTTCNSTSEQFWMLKPFRLYTWCLST